MGHRMLDLFDRGVGDGVAAGDQIGRGNSGEESKEVLATTRRWLVSIGLNAERGQDHAAERPVRILRFSRVHLRDRCTRREPVVLGPRSEAGHAPWDRTRSRGTAGGGRTSDPVARGRHATGRRRSGALAGRARGSRGGGRSGVGPGAGPGRGAPADAARVWSRSLRKRSMRSWFGVRDDHGPVIWSGATAELRPARSRAERRIGFDEPGPTRPRRSEDLGPPSPRGRTPDIRSRQSSRVRSPQRRRSPPRQSEGRLEPPHPGSAGSRRSHDHRDRG